MSLIMRSSSSAAIALDVMGEVSKLFAFLRRDLIVAWSYRAAFLFEAFSIVGQAVVFYIVSLMIDPSKMPTYGNVRSSYLAFVAIGIALSHFLQVGTGRAVSAMREEQFMGTLDAVLATPTSPVTFQLGSVFYELVLAPVRTLAYLAVFVGLLGVAYNLSGLGTALIIMAVFGVFVWGLGAACAAAALVLRRATGIVSLGAYVLAMASGAYFPLHLIPKSLARLAGLSPVALALSGMREVLIGGESWQQVRPEVITLAIMASCTLFLGILALHLALRREQRLGTLGLY